MPRQTGLGGASVGLLRATTPPEPEPEPIEPSELVDGQGGDIEPPAEVGPKSKGKASSRRRGSARAGHARKITLPDDVHRRAWLTAQSRGVSVSVVCAEALDRALPRWRVERE